jgi:4-hydroxybenzoate polyprenyltransferase
MSSRSSALASHTLPALVVALRPKQWTKNLLLFAGLLFASRLGDGERWMEAGAAFAAYCALSSAAYLVNDVRDAEQDAAHPTKRRRPIASGSVSPRQALTTAGALLVVGFALVAPLGARSLLFLGLFAILQVMYTLLLKRVALVDLATIASLFVIRAAAGADAIEAHISHWLLGCTALLAFFLATAKRRSELVLVRDALTPGRASLARYSLPVLDRLLPVLGAAAVGAYAVYAATAHDGTQMLLTLPFVAFGMVRYLFLIRRRDLGEEPEEVLLTDGTIIATVALWAITSAVILTS